MDNNLGKIICDLRNKKGVTQKELADAVHASDKAVSRWETGASLPTLETIHLLSKYFHVSFKDLLSARVSTENSDELANVIMKEFDEDSKKKTKIIRIILFVSIIAILILTSVMIFTNSYNKYKVYRVTSVSNDIYQINGMYVETRIKDSLFLNDVYLKNYEVKASDNVMVNLYYIKDNKKYILESYPRLYDIQFYNYGNNSIKDLSEVFDDLYLNVNIITKNELEYNYDIKLNFIIDFSNNKLYEEVSENNVPIITSSVDEITKILLDNGFENKNGDFLEKKNGEYLISYYFLSNKIKINFENSKMFYNLIYDVLDNELNVIVTNEQNIEVENYIYDTRKTEIIECQTGKCNNHGEMAKILKEKILDMLVK